MATQRAAVVPSTDWTVMVYLAGDNNLAEDMVGALQQVRDVAGRGEDDRRRLRVLAQLDPSASGAPTTRYAFFGQEDAGPLDDLAIVAPHLAETDTGSPNALTDFATWAVRGPKAPLPEDLWDCRARHYSLILSGHGSGATENVFLKDDSTGDALSVEELKSALRWATVGGHPARQEDCGIGQKIDLLGMDACFMSMVEVGYEIRDCASIMVAAQGFEPEFGWPYGRILTAADEVFPKPVSPRELAKTIVTEYVSHYSDYDLTAGRSVDLAAVDLEALENLVEPLRRLSGLLRRAMKDEDHGAYSADQIVLAHWEAQTYKSNQFVDLKDLCEILRRRFARIPFHTASDIVESCEAIITLFDPARQARPLVIRGGCGGFAYQHSNGLSIYFPWAEVAPNYDKLEFARRTQWRLFLSDYVAVTRRAVRPGLEPRSLATPAGAAQPPAGNKYAPASRYSRASRYGGGRRKWSKNYALSQGVIYYP